MKRFKRGSALTTVILAIFVMTVIGSSVMSMVVSNYKLRQLDLAIRKAEYKNEIIMDKIYEITQGSIVTAIGMAKKQAIDAVDKAVKEEEELYAEYVGEKQRLNDEWINEFGDGEFASDEARLQALNTYINENLDESYRNLTFNFLTAGVKNQYKIQNEYNSVFKALYRYTLDRDPSIVATIRSSVLEKMTLTEITNINDLIDNIKTGDKYRDVLNNATQNLYFNSESTFENKVKQNLSDDVVHIASDLSYNQLTQKITLTNEILYKAKGTPTVELSADFIISIPDFNSVSAIDQKAVEFSNPLIGDKALIAGGKLNVKNGVVNINGDAIASEGIINSSTLSSNGRLATAGDIILKNAELTSNILFYRNLYLRGTELNTVNFEDDVYARDDLEIENGRYLISQTDGNYYGFNDVNDENADSSSSIIINAASIDSSSSITLNNLYLAGRAFIDEVIEVNNPSSTYKTGESISVKGNYVAYQNPIMNTNSNYSSEKVNYASYIFNSTMPLKLVNSLVGQEDNIRDFDVNHKWKYFVDFCKYYPTLIKIPDITINSVKYMQGAGVGKADGMADYGIINAKLTGTAGDPAFKTNCANEYDLYTKYFGYYSPRTEIFGNNGWLNILSSETNVDSQPILVYDGDISLNDEDIQSYKIVICSGDINITLESSGTFYGVMIAGGDININGDITFNSSKNDIISLILEGADDSASTAKRKLYSLFKYDESGTRYVITVAGDSYINMNSLLGITNWKKKDWGYL